MFKQHVTVANVVHIKGKLLIVKEIINNKSVWNQPVGHLEANETIFAAASRKLYEETGINALPQQLIKIHQWIALDGGAFLRFLFLIELDEIPETAPQDNDIHQCLWLTANEILSSPCLRSPLVAESIRCFMPRKFFPLTLIDAYRFHPG
ncbi:MAG: NUDIX domain-containing protein [Candidatus Phlomobacter fragariae]